MEWIFLGFTFGTTTLVWFEPVLFVCPASDLHHIPLCLITEQ